MTPTWSIPGWPSGAVVVEVDLVVHVVVSSAWRISPRYSLLTITSTNGTSVLDRDRELLHQELERVVADHADDELLGLGDLDTDAAGISQPSGPAWPQHR